MPLPEIDLSRFNQMFLDEAADLLQVLETGILELNNGNVESDLHHSIFRAAHSLKGNAGMTGWESVAEFTHVVEGILDDIRSNKREVTPDLTELLLTAVDHLEQILTLPQREPLSESARLCLQKLTGTPPSKRSAEVHKNAPQATRYRVKWAPPSDCMTRGADPIRILTNLKALSRITRIQCHLTELPSLWELQPLQSYLSWSLQLETHATLREIRDIFAFQAVDEHLSIEAEGSTTEPTISNPETKSNTPAPLSANQPNTDTIRVAAPKLDAIFNLVGEMVITQSIAIQTLENHRDHLPEIESTLQELKRQTRELQDRIMSLRLVPVDQVFRRLPRLVHDLSQQLTKNIDLEVSGTDTEIDRAIVEQIGDPLIHLIRNCADHGIESPEDRLKSGKAVTGLIRLNARCQGGNTIVELNDDGRGLDTERIRAKALQLNLIQPQTKYTDKQLQSLIFHPGFSTAETVTAISGRGVGMDAVRRSIEALSGSIIVNSTPGKGSQFVIHLPMTMAILDGLLISIAGSLLVLPLASITECIRIKSGQLRSIPTEHANIQKEVIVNRDRVLAVLRVDKLFREHRDSIRESPLQQMAILIEHNDVQFAILADEILGKSQVVIKSIETNYQRVEGIQGATILGDGRVALVADIAAITRIQERVDDEIFTSRS